APLPEDPDIPFNLVLRPTPERVREAGPYLRLRQSWLRLTHGGEGYARLMDHEFLPVHYHFTIGRTALPTPILYTAYDLGRMREAGRRIFELLELKRDDLVINAFPFAPHLAFWMTYFATEACGIPALHTGGGRILGTHRVLEALERLGGTVLTATPSYAYHLLRTSALDAVADTWREAGLPFVGPVRGRRVRPDGLELTWRLLFPAREAGANFPLPFLIEWGPRPQESIAADSTGSTASGQQRNGSHGADQERGNAPFADGDLRLTRMHALVQSPARTSERLSQYYGPFLPLPERRGEAVVWDVGGVSLCLWPAESGPRARSAEVLSTRGERVVAVNLARTASAASASSGEGGQSLCPSPVEKGHLLHGLWVSIVPQSASKS
ncbi:MAG: VOC family protein, partial [Alicyclobacillus shizuokensis]|nr:VOC family protein [Alicyclobacillus shizuokensis]